MRQFCLYMIFTLALLQITACGEDRTREYVERTERDHWILDCLKERYLWAENINEEEVEWKIFFNDSKTFFNKVVMMANKEDVWSWCAVDTINEDFHQRGFYNHLDSYGMDFIFMTDPTGATSRQYARVITVIKNSPAERAGIKRGSFIASIDGNKITSSNTDKLMSGEKRTLEIADIAINEEAAEYYWTNVQTLTMEHSEYVEDLPFPITKTFNVNDLKVAYLMCNRLTEGPIEKNASSSAYKDELPSVMNQLKSDNPDVLILDLRLCNDGNLDMARLLASYIIPPQKATGAFAKTVYNTERQHDNTVFEFDPKALAVSLAPSQIIVVTSDKTKGPAEWLIRALLANMDEGDVFLIGTATGGQIAMTEEITSDYSITLHPAVAYVNDKNDSHDFADGIHPDYEIDERMLLQLHPYGDPNEAIIAILLYELSK